MRHEYVVGVPSVWVQIPCSAPGPWPLGAGVPYTGCHPESSRDRTDVSEAKHTNGCGIDIEKKQSYRYDSVIKEYTKMEWDVSTIQQIVDTIVNEVSPEKVILFGSASKGENTSQSDIDLLVVESEPFGKKRSRRKELGRLLKALLPFDQPIDILLYTHDEVQRWRSSLNHIAARALREGKVVYERP